MRKTKNLILIFLSMSLVILTSCNGESSNIKRFSVPKNVKTLQSGTVAQNDTYSLLWDSASACVILNNRKNGSIWSSIPYGYYKGEAETIEYKNMNLCSPIFLTCKNRDDSTETVYYSNELAGENSVHSVKIKNGLRVIYIFNKIGVTVPVEYILNENGLETRLLVNEITEKNDLVYKVSLTPFLASSKNTVGSYVFVPSGSGAIMSTDEVNGLRKYSEAVYGKDLTNQEQQLLSVERNVRIPAFGVKAEDGVAMLGFFEEGGELGIVEAMTGDSLLGYSAVYPTVQIRSTATSKMQSGNSTSIVEKLTLSKADTDFVSVKYIPLYGTDADYNGMANAYREYLKTEGILQGTEKASGLFLNLIGGVNVSQNFCGMPYKKTLAATTLDDAAEIVKDIADNAETPLVVKLSGFGKGGIDYSNIGGAFKISGGLGNAETLKRLYDVCNGNNTKLIMDFDLVYFSSSSNGFSVSSDSAKDANGLAAKQKKYSPIHFQEDKSGKSVYLLGRKQLTVVADKMVEKTKKWSIDGYSLSSLGSVAYADGSQSEYCAKNGIDKDVSAIFARIKNNGSLIATEDANLYAAGLSDYIFSSPTGSSGYLSFDEDIPFYQMVLKGTAAMSSQPINLAKNDRTEFLKAISTGSSPEFVLIKNFYDEFTSTAHSGLAASCYDDIKEAVIAMANEAKDLTKAVCGQSIVKYTRNGDLTRTVFENGITVYVNFGSTATVSEAGTVAAYGFIYTGDDDR